MLTFHDLAFDAIARRVRRDGREIQLTRKAFDLLAFLIERRPGAVPTSDIRARLWPDTFVSEITLQSLVSEIRRAIGVHGFGYAFMGHDRDAAERPQTGARRIRG